MGLLILRKIDLLFNKGKILYEKAYIMKLVPENLSTQVDKTENRLILARILAVSCMAPLAYMAPLLYIPPVPLDSLLVYSGQFLLFTVGYKTLTFSLRKKLIEQRLEVCKALDLENRFSELNMSKKEKDFILLATGKVTLEDLAKDNSSK